METEAARNAEVESARARLLRTNQELAALQAQLKTLTRKRSYEEETLHVAKKRRAGSLAVPAEPTTPSLKQETSTAAPPLAPIAVKKRPCGPKPAEPYKFLLSAKEVKARGEAQPEGVHRRR